MRLVWSVMKIHGLELLRRRLVLVLLLALPLMLYFALGGGDKTLAIMTGGTLMAFSIAGPAVFIVLSGRQVDQRLALAGFRPWHFIVGRILILELLGFVVCSLFASLIVGLAEPPSATNVFIGVYLVALVAVPFGLALSSIMPGDLEAFLFMIGVIGVQLGLPIGSAVGPGGPFYGPKQVLYASRNLTTGIAGPIIHAIVWAVVLTAIATASTARRARVAT